MQGTIYKLLNVFDLDAVVIKCAVRGSEIMVLAH